MFGTHQGGDEIMQLERISIRVLNKLFGAGYADERQILDLKLPEMLNLPGVSLAEIGEITKLQDAIKTHHVIRFLAREIADESSDEEGQSDPEEIEKEPKNIQTRQNEPDNANS